LNRSIIKPVNIRLEFLILIAWRGGRKKAGEGLDGGRERGKEGERGGWGWGKGGGGRDIFFGNPEDCVSQYKNIHELKNENKNYRFETTKYLLNYLLTYLLTQY